MSEEYSSRSLLDALFRHAGDPILVFDRELVCRFVNEAACRYAATTVENTLGYHASAIFDPSRYDAGVGNALFKALGGEETHYQIWRTTRGMGECCFDVRIESVADEGGQIIGAIFNARDITAQKQAEERARLAMMMFEHTTEGLMVLGADMRIKLVNPAFSSLLGFDAAEALHNQPELFVSSGANLHNPYPDIWHALEYNNSWQGEVTYRRRDGRLVPTWQTMVRVRDAQGEVEHYLAILTDLTERQRFEQQLERLVYYDVLTGLPNRALLADRIAQAMSRAELRAGQMALLFLDLDRFKAINDTLGHSQGDQLLRAVAGRLKQAAEGEMTISRYGSDQFVILLPKIGNPDQAAAQARRLLDSLEPTHSMGAHTLSATASLGISVYPDDGEDREVLIQHAETAMQAAKKAGRNTFRFYTQDMNQRSAEFLLLENHLRLGLQKQEFVLHYQPQIDIRTRAVIGMEALVRWQHPELGLVPPNRFIPAAEETGLIVPLGAWAMQEACRQNKAWQDAGLLFAPVAVNVSARQFSEDLEQVTAAALQGADLAAQWLELEVTESTLMEDVNEAIVMLGTLKRMGVKLAVDDFGTGYSSLSYLKRFPIDKLKVDRSFVIDILDDPDDAAIAGAVISLAKNLRLKVIAEGVETSAQLDFLSGLGCDEMQGYLVAKPLPAEQVADFLARWSAKQL
ncbi:sensor domain-containing protein [Chitinimonas taiwanensis]|uniref:PAS domain S-box-containing protein/diguanylate cyclase (GGDEF) domain-containing protein n=1 Tax=Chitinimonas taiwanensis DSM 18899 TaxID=1121279 RepID=A0A1K2HPR9_9NEIS|nr:EAL domain-containing protein [Chitinimonas taiwanensis]SFZ78808.1 PAS domain S-box-containing protein/diguanylate cyclase (GGDEF) domain-containing protein [Chitinimonas taiwanensis DSM 18899]